MKLGFFGDWGTDSPALSKNCAAAAAQGLDFAISGGDNVYECGLSDASRDVYNAVWGRLRTTVRGCGPIYSVMGNHDHRATRPQMQVELHSTCQAVDCSRPYASTAMWFAPAFWYTVDRRFTAAGEHLVARFLFVDTQLMGRDEMHRAVQVAYMRRQLASLRLDETEAAATPDALPPVEAMFSPDRPLRHRLFSARGFPKAQRRPDYIFVIAHHPVNSAGSHGTTSWLEGQFRQLLREAGVDAYMAGHEHDNELLVEEVTVDLSKGSAVPVSVSSVAARAASTYSYVGPDGNRKEVEAVLAEEVVGSTTSKFTLPTAHLVAGAMAKTFSNTHDGSHPLVKWVKGDTYASAIVEVDQQGWNAKWLTQDNEVIQEYRQARRPPGFQVLASHTQFDVPSVGVDVAVNLAIIMGLTVFSIAFLTSFIAGRLLKRRRLLERRLSELMWERKKKHLHLTELSASALGERNNNTLGERMIIRSGSP